MKPRSILRGALATTVTGVLLTGGVAVATHLDGNTIHGCISKRGDVRIVDDPSLCMANESLTEWNVVGPQGPQGPEGPQGPPGPADLYRRSVTVFIEPNSSAILQASCDPGDLLTGGGYGSVNFGTVSSSFPLDGDTWHVVASNENPDFADGVAAYVVCADISS